jgi:hypothetical protein
MVRHTLLMRLWFPFWGGESVADRMEQGLFLRTLVRTRVRKFGYRDGRC